MNALPPRLLLLLGECLAASALLVPLALAAAACFPRHAARRHLTWLALFAVLLALPVAASLVPSRLLIGPAGAPAILTSASASPLPARMGSAPLLPGFDPLLASLALWLAGFVLLVLRRALVLPGLHRLRRASVPHAFAEIDVRCDLRLARADITRGPMTWGIFHPVILLPGDALSWPRDRLALVLRHELAHVARHDTLSQTLAQLACALYWPNPLVWLAVWRLRREAEIAADDAVLASGVTPSSYAEALLALAAAFGGHARAAKPGLAMAAPSGLATRIQSILAPHHTRSGVTRMDGFKIACLSVCALAVMALARPDFAAAQGAAPAAPAAPTPLPPPPPMIAKLAPKGNVNVNVEVPARARIAARAAKIKAQAAMQAAVVAANDAPDPGTQADAESQSSTTINGVTTVTRTRNGKSQTQTFTDPQADAVPGQAARQARLLARTPVELASIGPEIDKALADARIAETVQQAVARAMAQAMPRIEAAVAQAQLAAAKAALPPPPPAPPAAPQ